MIKEKIDERGSEILVVICYEADKKKERIMIKRYFVKSGGEVRKRGGGEGEGGGGEGGEYTY